MRVGTVYEHVRDRLPHRFADLGEQRVKNIARPMPHKFSDQRIALHLCYGEIGIPAVAAAARYLSDARNVRYSPAATEPEYRVAAIA